jgi:HEAT repeat protein
MKAIRALTTLAATFFLLSGCATEDPESPEYWVGKLKTQERASAIKMLGRMGGEEGPRAKGARAAIPRLIAIYDADKARDELIPALIRMKASGPEIVRVMVAASIDQNEPTAAAAAASYLGDLGAKDRIKDLLSILDTTMPDEVKAAAIETVGRFKDPSAVTDLVRILERPIDQQGIHLNALACDALGRIGPPEANSGLPGMIKGVFLKDKFGRMAFRRCAIALIAFGEAAAERLTDAIEGKNEELSKWSEAQGHVKGLIVEEAAKVLGLLGHKAAVPGLIAELVVHNAPPPRYDAKMSQTWAIIEAQRFQNVVEALGRIGDERAIQPLSKFLYEGDYLRRIRVPFAINFIGHPSGVGVLSRCAERAVVDGLGWFRLDCAKYLGHLAPAADVGKLQKLIAGLEKMRKELTDYKAADPVTGGDFLAKLDGYKMQVGSLKECAEDIACWGRKLTTAGTHPHVIDQAVWQIARLSKTEPKGLDTLLQHAGSDNFALRNTVLDVLPGACDARCLPALKKVVADEAGKIQYKGFRERFLFVDAQLTAKGKG